MNKEYNYLDESLQDNISMLHDHARKGVDNPLQAMAIDDAKIIIKSHIQSQDEEIKDYKESALYWALKNESNKKKLDKIAKVANKIYVDSKTHTLSSYSISIMSEIQSILKEGKDESIDDSNKTELG